MVVYTHLGLVAGYVAEDELIEVTPSKIRYFLSLLLVKVFTISPVCTVRLPNSTSLMMFAGSGNEC